MTAAMDLGRIKCTRRCGALADKQVVGCCLERVVFAVAFARATGSSLGAAEPPQPESKHYSRSNNAKARSRKGGSAEEWHRDGVLKSRGTRQRRHGERHCAESDRRRHQSLRDISRFEEALRHGRENKKGDEEADAAIGDD